MLMETFILIGVGELSAADDGDMKSSLCDGDGAALMSNGVGAADNTAFDGVRLASPSALFNVRGIASALSVASALCAFACAVALAIKSNRRILAVSSAADCAAPLWCVSVLAASCFTAITSALLADVAVLATVLVVCAVIGLKRNGTDCPLAPPVRLLSDGKFM